MFKKKKFIIGGLVLLIAFVAVGVIAFRSAATYYYKVSEVTDMGSTVYGKNIRVSGKVAAGTVLKEDQGRTLKFTVTDDVANIPVLFRGTIPDTFKEDAEVVAEGKLGADGVFEATSILAKCPSKYEPVAPTSTS